LGSGCICNITQRKLHHTKEISYCFCQLTHNSLKNLLKTRVSTTPVADVPLTIYHGDFMISNNKLYYYNSNDQTYSVLCNFYVELLEEITEVYHNKNNNKSISLCIFTNGHKMEPFTMPLKEYKNLSMACRGKYPSIYFEPTATKKAERFEQYLTLIYQSQPINKVYIYRSSGWQKTNDKMYYIEDYMPKMPDNMLCNSGLCIPFDKSATPQSAYHNALSFLSVSKKNSLYAALIPLLFQHLGIMFTMFEKANFSPKFLLYIYGQSGAGKTSMTDALFYPFYKENFELKATFKDSITSIERKMARIFDWVFRVDDYHPQEGSQAQVMLKNKLEALIRYYGDGIGKSRSNPALEIIEGDKPHSVCCITGEKIDGTLSSYLRCLILNIEPDTYILDNLTAYQNNPQLLSTHIQYFIMYLETRFDEIVDHIASQQTILRKYYKPLIQEPRLVETAAQLHLVADIILQYGFLAEAILKGEYLQTKLLWENTILQTVKKSKLLSRMMSPAYMYINAIANLIDGNEIKITTKIDYTKHMLSYDGFTDNNFYYVNPNKIYTKVKTFWKDNGIEYTTSKDDSHQQLSQMGLLKTTSEGNSRTNYTYRTSLPDRPRLLALDIERMKILLENV
jgi:hypothetical protein